MTACLNGTDCAKFHNELHPASHMLPRPPQGLARIALHDLHQGLSGALSTMP